LVKHSTKLAKHERRSTKGEAQGRSTKIRKCENVQKNRLFTNVEQPEKLNKKLKKFLKISVVTA
jgi:hypothetical protein